MDMTECERIIRDGILPRSFFEPEEQCGFWVDENRKKVWAIEIDLYKEFERVCKKYGLPYFTDGGTTLGAVRHGGFIPWDDDLDVCMPRSAYNKLKSLSNEFNSPYFLQSPMTDEEYGYSFLRLRNSNTTVVVEPFNYCKFNQGIYIDIFPLDKVTEEDYLWRREQIHELIMKNSAYMRRNYKDKSERDIALIEKYISKDILPCEVFAEIENIATIDEEKNTEYLSLLVSTQYAPEKKIWSRRIFDSAIDKEFNGIKVKIPVGYDEQLQIYFGNYWEYPPVEKRGCWHNIRFYPDISYIDYYSNLWKDN